MKTNLLKETKFQKDNFAQRVNFAQVTALHESKKILKEVIKKN